MTNIEWTDTTWNPVTGCTKVSAGCKNCYAEGVAERFWGNRKFTDVRTHEDRLDAPLRWRKPRRVFVNSMSDLFHDDVPVEFIVQVFNTMACATTACGKRHKHEEECWTGEPHTFQILTKRPERMRLVLLDELPQWTAENLPGESPLSVMMETGQWPLPNVWLGVSVEDQKAADERIPLLLQTPAAVRFISAEPLLGQLDIGMSSATCKCCDRWPSRWIRLHRPVGPDLPHLVGTKGGTHVADCGIYRAHSNPHGALSVMTPGGLLGIKPAEFDCLPGIDWVIVGGESGPGARPCEVAWIRSIVEQCKAAGVACFVKHLGAKPVARDRWDMSEAVFVSADAGGWDEAAGSVVMRLRDHKGGDPSEWPEELRVREFPR